jgi:hypothetical protein
MASLMRRTLVRTRAPIFNSLSRIVPQVAWRIGCGRGRCGARRRPAHKPGRRTTAAAGWRASSWPRCGRRTGRAGIPRLPPGQAVDRSPWSRRLRCPSRDRGPPRATPRDRCHAFHASARRPWVCSESTMPYGQPPTRAVQAPARCRRCRPRGLMPAGDALDKSIGQPLFHDLPRLHPGLDFGTPECRGPAGVPKIAGLRRRWAKARERLLAEES